MRIGFLLPGGFALSGQGNGVAVQAMRQAEALERRGHDVVRLNPWESQNGRQLDVLQFYFGGPQLHDITTNRQLIRDGLLVFAPIIDSNQSFSSYRFAALCGSLSSRFLTVPGVLRRQAQRSDVVLCRSHHERDRLVLGLGVSPNKVERVLNGCAAPVPDSSDVARARSTLGLPPEFILHVSAFTQERKNVLRLIEAVEPLGLPLVIAGTATPGSVLERIERVARKGSWLRLLGWVDPATKAALYASCRVFCMPSMHEGTGLAAVEAAAYGARVVITRNGGPRDYFLQHADYVDPLDVADIRRAVVAAWNRPMDRALQQHVIQNLSWDASAAALERVYGRHLERRSSPAQTVPPAAASVCQQE
jgi:glycosyltransferase involved in cell wall biosynthesis